MNGDISDGWKKGEIVTIPIKKRSQQLYELEGNNSSQYNTKSYHHFESLINIHQHFAWALEPIDNACTPFIRSGYLWKIPWNRIRRCSCCSTISTNCLIQFFDAFYKLNIPSTFVNPIRELHRDKACKIRYKWKKQHHIHHKKVSRVCFFINALGHRLKTP